MNQVVAAIADSRRCPRIAVDSAAMTTRCQLTNIASKQILGHATIGPFKCRWSKL